MLICSGDAYRVSNEADRAAAVCPKNGRNLSLICLMNPRVICLQYTKAMGGRLVELRRRLLGLDTDQVDWVEPAGGGRDPSLRLQASAPHLRRQIGRAHV